MIDTAIFNQQIEDKSHDFFTFNPYVDEKEIDINGTLVRVVKTSKGGKPYFIASYWDEKEIRHVF
jgi:hypothetical protein